jgi:hypothetical protein
MYKEGFMGRKRPKADIPINSKTPKTVVMVKTLLFDFIKSVWQERK